MQTVQTFISHKGLIELMEKVLGMTKARTEFGILIERVQHQGDTYIIERHGKPAAAVVPMKVYEEWKRQRSEFLDFIRQTQQDIDLTPDEADQIAAEAVKAIRAGYNDGP